MLHRAILLGTTQGGSVKKIPSQTEKIFMVIVERKELVYYWCQHCLAAMPTISANTLKLREKYQRCQGLREKQVKLKGNALF